MVVLRAVHPMLYSLVPIFLPNGCAPHCASYALFAGPHILAQWLSSVGIPVRRCRMPEFAAIHVTAYSLLRASCAAFRESVLTIGLVFLLQGLRAVACRASCNSTIHMLLNKQQQRAFPFEPSA